MCCQAILFKFQGKTLHYSGTYCPYALYVSILAHSDLSVHLLQAPSHSHCAQGGAGCRAEGVTAIGHRGFSSARDVSEGPLPQLVERK